jgi:hypothetical protein
MSAGWWLSLSESSDTNQQTSATTSTPNTLPIKIKILMLNIVTA